MSNDSIGKTLGVATALCIVCSILVSGGAVLLKPTQELNKALDRKKNILIAAGLYHEGADVNTLYQKVETKLVDLSTGEVSEMDPDGYDFRSAAGDPKQNYRIPVSQDKARIKVRAKLFPVYFVKGDDGKTSRLVLPIYGKGLWSTMYGFIAIAPDGNHVERIVFYEDGETPGLGGEINNPKWQSGWEGKEIYGNSETPELHVIKGTAPGDAPHKIDGLSGATLTSNGVTGLIHYWFGENGYGKFLSQFRSQNGGRS